MADIIKFPKKEDSDDFKALYSLAGQIAHHLAKLGAEGIVRTIGEDYAIEIKLLKKSDMPPEDKKIYFD